MDKLRFWDPSPSKDAAATATAGAASPYTFQLGGNSTVVMSDYHICRYDTLLGVLVCVGDDAKVLVMGKEMCRQLLPLRQGTHWLDLFLYTGTSTFLLLSSDVLLCMDYNVCAGDSQLTPNGAPFTCLHVPKGLTCGAVGRKNGVVSYFRLNPITLNPEDRPVICWTTTELDILGLCAPLLKDRPVEVDSSESSNTKFFSWGSVLSMDSYPENPNAFIGVVAGVPGVVKWYIDEARLSAFFDASAIAGTPDGMLAACRVSPGGNYVAATTMYSTKLLLWTETKKKKNKMCELYWSIDLASSISHAIPSSFDAFFYNEYCVGIHIARTKLADGFHSTNDKHSQMYLLLHGQRDIVEVVIRLDDKKVIRQDKIIDHLNAYTGTEGKAAAKNTSAANTTSDSLADNYYNVFSVEPCMISSYWGNGLTDVDLEALFVTSEGGLRPILAKRNRQTGGLESTKELRELSAKCPWYPRALLIRLPEAQLRQLASQIKNTPISSTWERLLRGGTTLLQQSLPENECQAESGTREAELWKKTIMVTVTDAAQAMCLSPESNEAFAMHPRALQKCMPWVALALEQDPASLVAEVALPSFDSAFLPTELIVRVYSNEAIITVMKNDIRRNTGAFVFNLDRAALQLEGPGTPGTRMVQQCSFIDARLEPSSVTSRMRITNDGKSILVLLEDGTVAIVDLSGQKDEDGKPFMVLIPGGLLPTGAKVISLDSFWRATPGLPDSTLCLAYLMGDGKGFLLWNVSTMRMIAFSNPPYAAKATRLCVTTASVPPPPNLSGDIMRFEVSLRMEGRLASGSEYGSVSAFDALGAALFKITLGCGLAEGFEDVWCYRVGAAEEWKPIPAFVLTAVGGEMILTIEAQGTNLLWSIVAAGMHMEPENPVIVHGSIVNVEATWSLGKAELCYDTPQGEMRSYVLNTAQSPTKAVTLSPTIAFVTAEEIAMVDIGSLFESTNSPTSSTAAPTTAPAICRLDGSRRLEYLTVYRARGSVIVITRDANGWRWLNILDSRTAKPRMEPYATLDFAGEDKIQVLPIEIDNTLHLYFLGSNNGVLGHFFIEANLGPKESGIIERKCFGDRRSYCPVPPTFRGYGRFLPPPLTLKQETGFFKRLMTLPWEDIALKLESETLRKTRANDSPSAPMPPPSSGRAPSVSSSFSSQPNLAASPPPPSQNQNPTTTTAGSQPSAQDRAALERNQLLGSRAAAAASNNSVAATASSSTTATNTGAASRSGGVPSSQPSTLSSELPKGSRYAQLKAIAERENVSLIEAKRMMSENVRKVQERGERLREMGDRSSQMADQALTFQSLATQLKEKQKNSWF